MSLLWLDSHCHFDAPEFDLDRTAVMQNAQSQGVAWCVMPAVQAKDFLSLQKLAQAFHQPYALGIHPLYVPQAQEQDLDFLAQCIEGALAKDAQGLRSDARLVAVGEIGLDFFVPALCEPAMREKQEFFYHAQLKLAQKFKLPVILHVRKSADELLKGLRRHGVQGGIAHAFNGSFQQAQTFVEMGFALGFGGALTFDRALQLRRLANELPLSAVVLETDAPDIPPHWLYKTQAERKSEHGLAVQARNEPSQLPRIGAVLAQLRGLSVPDIAAATLANAQRVLPQLHHFENP
ncbi:MAG: TatD family hydrolase [Burkholderiales bacterium]|nr:TatD family hydrolase [Burkholderiales bacterium]